ncbi:hypothetical protein TURU_091840 [Turdus rufiventris]|nr:hypothetical protein TURU_091840 [Turdus rufiventris]
MAVIMDLLRQLQREWNVRAVEETPRTPSGMGEESQARKELAGGITTAPWRLIMDLLRQLQREWNVRAVKEMPRTPSEMGEENQARRELAGGIATALAIYFGSFLFYFLGQANLTTTDNEEMTVNLFSYISSTSKIRKKYTTQAHGK